MITSVQNSLIKDYAALSQKKERTRQQLMLVETQHPIEEALKAGLTLKAYFSLTTDEAEAKQQMAEALLPSLSELTASLSARYADRCYPVSPAVMRKLATTDSIPPCVAVFEHPKTTALSTFSSKTAQALVVVLDGLQDPGNVGTLIRSAAAFSASGLLVTANTVDVFSPKVIRASAGLVFRLPVTAYQQPMTQLLSQPELAEFQWLVTTSHATVQGKAPVHYREVNYQQALLLILGNEGAGLPDTLLAHPQVQPVTIPMNHSVESLNVSVSGSILLAEIAHQRLHKNTHKR